MNLDGVAGVVIPHGKRRDAYRAIDAGHHGYRIWSPATPPERGVALVDCASIVSMGFGLPVPGSSLAIPGVLRAGNGDSGRDQRHPLILRQVTQIRPDARRRPGAVDTANRRPGDGHVVAHDASCRGLRRCWSLTLEHRCGKPKTAVELPVTAGQVAASAACAQIDCVARMIPCAIRRSYRTA